MRNAILLALVLSLQVVLGCDSQSTLSQKQFEGKWVQNRATGTYALVLREYIDTHTQCHMLRVKELRQENGHTLYRSLYEFEWYATEANIVDESKVPPRPSPYKQQAEQEPPTPGP